MAILRFTAKALKSNKQTNGFGENERDLQGSNSLFVLKYLVFFGKITIMEYDRFIA